MSIQKQTYTTKHLTLKALAAFKGLRAEGFVKIP
jgi:hypothetical protein